MTTLSKTQANSHTINFSKFMFPIMHGLILLPLLLFSGLTLAYLLQINPDMNLRGLLGITGTGSMLTFGAMLACTPISIITGWQRPRRLRKPFGLYAFVFAAIHFVAYIDQEGTVSKAIAEMISDGLVLFGFLGLAIMAPLAATSTRWAIRKMRKNWKRLHQATYAATVFISLHLLLVGEGIGAIYLLLLIIRVPPMKNAIIKVRKKYQADRRARARAQATA